MEKILENYEPRSWHTQFVSKLFKTNRKNYEHSLKIRQNSGMTESQKKYTGSRKHREENRRHS